MLTSIQEVSSLESKIKELEAEKESNQQTETDLSSKLKEVQETLERERKEVAEKAVASDKADTPQEGTPSA